MVMYDYLAEVTDVEPGSNPRTPGNTDAVLERVVSKDQPREKPETESEDTTTAKERGGSHPERVLKPGVQDGVPKEAGESRSTFVPIQV